ncbi:MAG: peptide chain release factor RF1 [Candidatus Westeberhardia cardiocondylae]|nr:peptide chain release factor RF1 [Candidatus Westeberhardia cardiocondylae]
MLCIMKNSVILKLKLLQKRFKDIEISLGNSNIIRNPETFKSLSKEYAKLSEIISYFRLWYRYKEDIYTSKEMLLNSELCDLAKETIEDALIQKKNIENKLYNLLYQKNLKNKKYGCFLEIRSGVGGNEASLFAGVLFKMYNRFACMQGWNIDIVSSTVGEYGGYKEIISRISHKDSYSQLKFESGGHRVQRIPDTESQGRVHSSSCTVVVIPEIPKKLAKNINFNDIRIDTFRSSGAGGQHVNTTDSAIRVVHIPTGIIVECQDERSQHKNKAKALSLLSSKLYNNEKNRIKQEESLKRRCLLGTGDRSDRIRTYNFPKKRVTDHRIGLTVYCLDKIIRGNLQILINPMIQKKSSLFS